MPRSGQVAIAACFLVVIGLAVWYKNAQGDMDAPDGDPEVIDLAHLPAPPPRPDVSASLPPALAAAIEARLKDVDDNPRSGPAWGKLAMTYDANGLQDLALLCYETAAALDPEEGRWPYFRALIFARNGDMEAAIRSMELVSTVREDFNPAHIWLALWYLDLNQLDKATYQLQLADRMAPEDTLVMRTQAELWLKTGAESDVVTVLGSIAQANPNDAYGRYLVGMALLKLGRTDEAALMFVGSSPERPAWGDEWTFERFQMRVKSPD